MTGDQLRQLRRKFNLTQAQVAERMGTTVTTVARWERSERAISEPIARFVELLAKTEWRSVRGPRKN